jgi:hypothetical protein
MTLNLEAEIEIPCDVTKWTKLQTEICMNVANAKFYAFIAEAERAAELTRLGFITRTTAADYLHQIAIYSSLYFEYGTKRVQAIMAEAFEAAA